MSVKHVISSNGKNNIPVLANFCSVFFLKLKANSQFSFCLATVLLTGLSLVSNAQNLYIQSNLDSVKILCDKVYIGTTPFQYALKPNDGILKFVHPDGIHTNEVIIKNKVSRTPNASNDLYSIMVMFDKESDKNYVEVTKMLSSKDSLLFAIQIEKADSIKIFKRDFSKNHPHVFLWQITGIIVRDFQFSFESKIKPKFAVGLTFGYKPPKEVAKKTYTNNNTFDSNGPVNESIFVPFAESIYGGLNFKYFFVPMFFVSTELFGRTLRYDNVTVKWDDSSNDKKGGVIHHTDELKATINAIGIKVMPGFRKVIPIDNETGFVFEVYAGLGMRYKTYNLYHYNQTDTYPSYMNKQPETELNKQERYSSWMPSVQCGIKIGLAF